MDHRDDQPDNIPMWNHASTSGQPLLRPLSSNSLKPLSPLRAMPPDAEAHNTAQPAAAQPSPMPAWQPGQTARVGQLYQPIPMAAWPVQATPPVAHSYPPVAGAPALGAQPMQAPPPQQPIAPAQTVPVRDNQPQAPQRRVWTQTTAQPSPTVQPRASLSPMAETMPRAAWVPAGRARTDYDFADGLPNHDTKPILTEPNDPRANLMTDTPRRRRVTAHTLPSAETLRVANIATPSAHQAADALPRASANAGDAFSSETLSAPLVAQTSQPEIGLQSGFPVNEPAAMPAATAQRATPAFAGNSLSPTDGDLPPNCVPAYVVTEANATAAQPLNVNTQAKPLTVNPQQVAMEQRDGGGMAQPRSAVKWGDAPSLADANEDDSGRYEAVSARPLAEPLPVPTSPFMPRKQARKHQKHPLLITFAVLALAGGIGAGLYFTGIWAQLMQTLNASPIVQEYIPAIFGRSTTTAQVNTPTIAPATLVAATELLSATVEPATATAPAQLLFQVETNVDTTALRLLTETGATLHTSAVGTPQGDGMLWKVTTDVEDPYTGKVRIFLRDQNGTWSEGAITCDIDVQ